MKRMGLDLGSTTVKGVVLGEDGSLLYSSYRRHYSKISQTAAELLQEVAAQFGSEELLLSISGSAGMGLSNALQLPFVQEVYATRSAVRRLLPGTNVVIELGGEDAKILFLSGGLEVRMNGSCAGGTGAFIDQMATLMGVEPAELNTLAAEAQKRYPIASRCGVFAKSDIQPLINQGAKKQDIAESIFYAVVNQTVAGLAQGRSIAGKVVYLGGPLTFFNRLRAAFNDVLKVTGTCPENSLYFVAIGAAYSKYSVPVQPGNLAKKIAGYHAGGGYNSCPPLFRSNEEYRCFVKRHEETGKAAGELTEPNGVMYLGVDAGSTTVKAVLCDQNGKLLFPFYRTNSGNPVPLLREYLTKLYQKWPNIKIGGAAVTGYGEDIIRNAFHLDYGLVETVAHYTAAKKFRPDVDFIIDIGGQDIKCFKIKNGGVDSLFLNEACSSGCGSFLQTFAKVLGYSMQDFSALALQAEKPVDLGSRCTVFMNSAVKQAQKDGADVKDIAAGLCISVVKNALYKVIRCASPNRLGKSIVVQGGTFLNNAVLRAFEQETGRQVIRPQIAGLMGAYGAALYALERAGSGAKSGLITAAELQSFVHSVRAVTCKGCSNGCRLTVNTFTGGRTYIAGNRCSKPVRGGKLGPQYNLYAYKQQQLEQFMQPQPQSGAPTVGLPLGLNMYELLPFWHTLFSRLGFRVVSSKFATHELYLKGQGTIPSDTVCYPAKLMHGHIEYLLQQGVDLIFYPCMSYNVEEHLGHNHYNCPVVAYYPKVIGANMPNLKQTNFVNDFIGLHKKHAFAPHFQKIMAAHGFSLPLFKIKQAAKAAYAVYAQQRRALTQKANEFLTLARQQNLPVIVLAGRPYHIDPEVNHGIDKLICELGAVVLTEDSVSPHVKRFATTVLNQWTYHARLYAAAKFVTKQQGVNISLVQLVSFGCGVDAVTTDETREILEAGGKLYTQIKIDEITNLGAVRIRLRSLFAMLQQEKAAPVALIKAKKAQSPAKAKPPKARV